jgi:N-methylhydantoinase A
VTDANVVLGRVDESNFAGGSMTLDAGAARDAVAALAAELDLDTTALAEGICDVANAKMAQAIRTLTVDKGIEPRDFALVAIGGAGPMHAVFLARELGIREVLVPRFPGAFSAWGMLESEVRKDASRAYFTPLAAADRGDLARLLGTLEEEGYAALAEEGITRETGRVQHALDLRYIGQEYTLTIPLTGAAEPEEDGFEEALSRRFHDAHQTRFGHANLGAPVEVVAVRTTALGDLGRAEPTHLEETADAGYASVTRQVTFGRAARETIVVRRDDLRRGAVVDGPAVISEHTATTVVPPGAQATVDEFGTLVVRVGEEE